MKRKIFSVLLTLTLVLGFSIVSTAPVMAANVDVYPGDSIQTAIDGASDGDVIYVHEGTYSENIVIDGVDISLVAVGEVTIEGATNLYANKTIAVYDSTCTINGFTVKYNGVAIYARAASWEGDEPVDVTIVNNFVTDYIKNGITVNGDLARGSVRKNTVVSDADSIYAQNGIQFGYGASGHAHQNTVETDWYTGEDWTASGILLFEADKVSVKLNEVINCQTAIGIETWGWFWPSASKNIVVNNVIDGAAWGISVAAYSWDYSTMDCQANNNKVTNNKVKATDGEIGISVGAYYISGDFTAQAHNNKVINNKIKGFEESTYFEGDTATKFHANKLSPVP